MGWETAPSPKGAPPAAGSRPLGAEQGAGRLVTVRDRELPDGFVAGGRNVGIKSSKRDMGVLLSEWPARMAACLTTNRSRAACVDRTERLRNTSQMVRGIVAVSGNANALTGQQGRADDEAMAARVAQELGVTADEILTACTGVIGYRLPIRAITDGASLVVKDLSRDPSSFAEAILTTDRVPKLASTELFVQGKRIRLHGIVKGAGMISPAMATMLCFVTTDAVISTRALQAALSSGVEESFNQLTVDNDMSTNDMVVILANGRAGNREITEPGMEYEAFVASLAGVLRELAKKIARDGEGANRLLEVVVDEAASREDARAMSRAIAGSMLVKAAVFGADPACGGRIISAAGACAARRGCQFDAGKVALWVQGEPVFRHGCAVQAERSSLRVKLAQREVEVRLSLDVGAQRALAWGCDLSYDYVKINGDYAAATVVAPDGRVGVREQLADLGPTLKRKLLVQTLRGIERFRGTRAVLRLGGSVVGDPWLKDQFAGDLRLLRSVGLRPVVVCGAAAQFPRAGGETGGAPESGDSDCVPVITPAGRGSAEGAIDSEADVLAAELARALSAERLVFVGDVPGLLEGEGVVSELTSGELEDRLEAGEINDGMHWQLECALRALAGGVQSVHLIDGRVPHNFIAGLLADTGVGTLIRKA